MQFIDEAKINITSGCGGNGCISFRREKYEPLGGPNGGNGGRGGNIVLKSNTNINTLLNFRFKKYFNAQNGENGKGSNKNGKSGDDLILEVPVGSQVYTEDGELLLFDFVAPDQTFIVSTGGRGGLGNSYFKSSTRQSPELKTDGVEGEEILIYIKLKLLSDVGLIGLPNAGKSTFLSRTTAAKPKIANYPFTTLKPMLGIVHVEHEEFILADIPGLIEGAHQGSGLGDKFLKHIERCNILIHLIDGSTDDIARDYLVIRNELRFYSPLLENKYEIVCINKIDILTEVEIEERLIALKAVCSNTIFLISTHQGEGLKPVLIEALVRSKRRNEEDDDE